MNVPPGIGNISKEASPTFSVYGLKSAGGSAAGRIATAAKPRTTMAQSSDRCMGADPDDAGGGIRGGRIILGLLIALNVGGFGAPGHAADASLTRFEFAENHMGTRFRIVLY